MQELGLRGNKILMLQDAGYTFEEACTYVNLEDVEHRSYNSPMQGLPIDWAKFKSDL